MSTRAHAKGTGPKKTDKAQAKSKAKAARRLGPAPKRPTAKGNTGPKRPTPKGKATGKDPSSAHRRRRQARRIPVVVAAVIALTIVATSFPLSALLTQHRQLAAAASQLAQVRHQNTLLAEQEQQLNAKTEIQRLARQDYQLVLPGQSLYNVLPAAGQPATATTGVPTLGDPANQPLVSPANAPNMSPDPGLPTTTVAGSQTSSTVPVTHATTSGGGGFLHRVTSTLEFWK
jgi:cell division protein FtsB